MRILHCSDLHASESAFQWVIKQSLNYNLVCLTGDLLDLNPYRLPAGQIERVISYLNLIKVPLAICSGNHDNFGAYDDRLVGARWMQNLRRPTVWLDGDRFEIGGHRFRAFPWMSMVPATADADEIWLMHAPPDLSPTSIVRGGVDFGDFALGELCRSGAGPCLVLSGHVHERVRWIAKIGRSWSLNPGCEPDATIPNHIVIELSRGHATFHGSAESLGSARAVVPLT